MSGTTASTGPSTAAIDQNTTDLLSKGAKEADNAVNSMDAAFSIAIAINAMITSHKTVDGAIETAAQQLTG